MIENIADSQLAQLIAAEQIKKIWFRTCWGMYRDHLTKINFVSTKTSEKCQISCKAAGWQRQDDDDYSISFSPKEMKNCRILLKKIAAAAPKERQSSHGAIFQIGW